LCPQEDVFDSFHAKTPFGVAWLLAAYISEGLVAIP